MGLLITAVCFLFVGCNLLIVGSAVLLANPKRSSFKNRTDGIVEGYGFVEKGKDSYRYCRVTYSVDGQDYSCNQYDERLKGISEEDIKKRFPQGSVLEVHYHSKHPERSYCGNVVQKGIGPGIIGVGVGLLLLMTSGLFFVLSFIRA